MYRVRYKMYMTASHAIRCRSPHTPGPPTPWSHPERGPHTRHRCHPRHRIARPRPIRRLLPGRIRRLPPMPCPLPAAPLLCRQESVLPSLPRRHQSQRQVRRRLHRTDTSEPTMEPAVLDQPHPLTSSPPADAPYIRRGPVSCRRSTKRTTVDIVCEWITWPLLVPPSEPSPPVPGVLCAPSCGTEDRGG